MRRVTSIPVFDHIPKTAGSTVREVLFNVYGPRVVPIVTRDKYAEELASIVDRLNGSGEPVGALASHAGAGLHLRLPPQHSYPRFTWFREPIARTLSMWHHLQYLRHRYGRGTSAGSLLEWLEREPAHSCNQQVSHLGGLRIRAMLDGHQISASDFDDALLQRAIVELDAYDAIGLVEQFDLSLLMVGRAMGWRSHHLVYRVTNVGTVARAAEQLTREELKALRDVNALDLELYEHARHRFKRDTEHVSAPALRIYALRASSRAYGRVYPIIKRG
jgi:hypothetical protein